MTGANRIREYIANMTSLLAVNPKLYGVMVQRQIRGRLLTSLSGGKDELEAPLWELFWFCIGESPPATLEEPMNIAAQRLDKDPPSRFPSAAKAVLEALGQTLETGFYPA